MAIDDVFNRNEWYMKLNGLLQRIETLSRLTLVAKDDREGSITAQTLLACISDYAAQMRERLEELRAG
jgi:hypothetical protein